MQTIGFQLAPEKSKKSTTTVKMEPTRQEVKVLTHQERVAKALKETMETHVEVLRELAK